MAQIVVSSAQSLPAPLPVPEPSDLDDCSKVVQTAIRERQKEQQSVFQGVFALGAGLAVVSFVGVGFTISQINNWSRDVYLYALASSLVPVMLAIVIMSSIRSTVIAASVAN